MPYRPRAASDELARLVTKAIIDRVPRTGPLCPDTDQKYLAVQKALEEVCMEIGIAA
jgi:hypothetical protein